MSTKSESESIVRVVANTVTGTRVAVGFRVRSQNADQRRRSTDSGTWPGHDAKGHWISSMGAGIDQQHVLDVPMQSGAKVLAVERRGAALVSSKSVGREQ